MNNNIHRKLTEDDRFACRCPNNNKVRHKEKLRQRRCFLRKMNIQLLKERAANERF